MIAFVNSPGSDDEELIDLQIKALLPSIISPTVVHETKGVEQHLPASMIGTELESNDDPILAAKYTEISLIALAISVVQGNRQAELLARVTIKALKTLYETIGIEGPREKASEFAERSLVQAERFINPQGMHDLAALMPTEKPDSAEIAAREHTAKILEEITGLSVEILPRDDYRRQYYQFTVKHIDPSKTEKDEPPVAGELHDYIAGIIRDSKVNSVFLEMSPKNEWRSSVKLHFGAGSGFSLPAQEALVEAKQFKKLIEAHAKPNYRDGLSGYQNAKLANVNFVDDGKKRTRG